MANIRDLSDFLAASTGANGGTPEVIFQAWTSYPGAARAVGGDSLVSLWTFPGTPGGGASTPPGAGEACDRNTAGAIQFHVPTGGREKWLTRIDVLHNNTNQLGTAFTLFDRLYHNSGLNGAIFGAPQAVSGAPTRHTDGAGNLLFLEVYATVGNSLVTATVNYVNQDGNPSSGTARFGRASSNASFGRIASLVPVVLAPGDTGVRSVTSVTLSGSTGAAGDFGVTIARRLAFLPVVGVNGYYGGATSFLTGPQGPIKIEEDACLFGALGLGFQIGVSQLSLSGSGMHVGLSTVEV